jgi:hypothetical protein
MRSALARACAVAVGGVFILVASVSVASPVHAGPLGSSPGPAPPGSVSDLWKQASLVTAQGPSIAAAAKAGAREVATARSDIAASVRRLRAIIRALELTDPSGLDQPPADAGQGTDPISGALLREYTGVLTVRGSLARADRILRQTDPRLDTMKQSLESLSSLAATTARLGRHEAAKLSPLQSRLRRWQRWTTKEQASIESVRQEVATRWGQLDAIRRALQEVWQYLPAAVRSRLTPDLPVDRSFGPATTVTHPGSGCVSSVHSGVRLSDDAIATYAAQAGFRDFDLAVAVAIALAESGGDPRAVCVDTNGSRDEGLWQINSVHGYASSCTFDPSCSAAVAYRLYVARGHAFGDWVTYSSDRFLTYLPRGAQAAAAVGGRTPGPLPGRN